MSTTMDEDWIEINVGYLERLPSSDDVASTLLQLSQTNATAGAASSLGLSPATGPEGDYESSALDGMMFLRLTATTLITVTHGLVEGRNHSSQGNAFMTCHEDKIERADTATATTTTTTANVVSSEVSLDQLLQMRSVSPAAALDTDSTRPPSHNGRITPPLQLNDEAFVERTISAEERSRKDRHDSHQSQPSSPSPSSVLAPPSSSVFFASSSETPLLSVRAALPFLSPPDTTMRTADDHDDDDDDRDDVPSAKVTAVTLTYRLDLLVSNHNNNHNHKSICGANYFHHSSSSSAAAAESSPLLLPLCVSEGVLVSLTSSSSSSALPAVSSVPPLGCVVGSIITVGVPLYRMDSLCWTIRAKMSSSVTRGRRTIVGTCLRRSSWPVDEK